MEVAHTHTDVQQQLGASRCVLIPTMGALHEGHLSLVDVGRRAADDAGLPLAASIFVNPEQFNDPADLEHYPRPLERDLDALRAHGVDLAFVPDEGVIYPPDDPGAAPQPEVPAVGRLPGLEDRFRPGHFPGVCRVVSRLFDLLNPAAAVFGEKDWQQSRVVKAMCASQDRRIEILVGPTIRESSGLAMSSRNTLLPADVLDRAAGVQRGIRAAQQASDPAQALLSLRSVLAAHDLEIEYATIRDSETLIARPHEGDNGPWRVLVAARLAGVRLLDNAPWPA